MLEQKKTYIYMQNNIVKTRREKTGLTPPVGALMMFVICMIYRQKTTTLWMFYKCHLLHYDKIRCRGIKDECASHVFIDVSSRSILSLQNSQWWQPLAMKEYMIIFQCYESLWLYGNCSNGNIFDTLTNNLRLVCVCLHARAIHHYSTWGCMACQEQRVFKSMSIGCSWIRRTVMQSVGDKMLYVLM